MGTPEDDSHGLLTAIIFVGVMVLLSAALCATSLWFLLG